MRRWVRDLASSDKGVSLALVAFTLVLLLGASAIAVDLAAMRLDRSADQKVTDSAASAGALAAFESENNGYEGCVAALEYVAINSGGIGSIDTSGCVSIPDTCNPANPVEHSVAAGSRFNITFTYPVTNDHDLMTSAQLGAPTQAVVPEDGEPCERVGVQMSAVHTSFFAQLLGFNQGTTTVHTVARAFLPPPEGPPLNLLVLDRSGCDAIHAHGQGGVIVNKVTDPEGNEFPGAAAADSDASSACTPAVLHAAGRGMIRADGPSGCATETVPGTGEGCGLAQTLAPGTPGCNPPACQVDGSNASITPDPTPLPDRMTRAPVDYEYNCWGNYTSPPPGVWSVPALTAGTGQDIDGCPHAANPHIYSLINEVGPSGASGLPRWSNSESCEIVAHESATFNGSVWVDCDDLVVEGHVVINGNVIFEGNVWVKSQGSLTINNSPGWAFFRGRHSLGGNGYFRKDGQASLTIEQTAVYLSQTSWIEIAGGGNGVLRWVAPTSGRFEHLALWSDSASTHFWSGQGELTMVGVFFTPWAQANYSGNSGQNQTDAQWVAWSLEAHGQGRLEITPRWVFPVKQPEGARTTIIR